MPYRLPSLVSLKATDPEQKKHNKSMLQPAASHVKIMAILWCGYPQTTWVGIEHRFGSPGQD